MGGVVKMAGLEDGCIQAAMDELGFLFHVPFLTSYWSHYTALCHLYMNPIKPCLLTHKCQYCPQTNNYHIF